MKHKKTAVAPVFAIIVGLLAAGASSAFAQESHIGKVTGHANGGGQLRPDAGKQLYRRYCIGCHGPQGDGNGENATWIEPKPRDFTAAVFKCRSTPTGTLPTDDDLFNSVTRGFITTNMPAWKPLTNHNRADLVAYIKTYSVRWKTDMPVEPIVIPPEPAVTIEGILHGQSSIRKLNAGNATVQKVTETGPLPRHLPTQRTTPFAHMTFRLARASSAASRTRIFTGSL